jgi:hypothetical protein
LQAENSKRLVQRQLRFGKGGKFSREESKPRERERTRSEDLALPPALGALIAILRNVESEMSTAAYDAEDFVSGKRFNIAARKCAVLIVGPVSISRHFWPSIDMAKGDPRILKVLYDP